MTIFQDSIVVVIFILLFIVFLMICAFVNCMYRVKIKKLSGERGMKPYQLVFAVLMIQTLFALVWFKFGLVPFCIWICGCAIADVVSGIVWSENK